MAPAAAAAQKENKDNIPGAKLFNNGVDKIKSFGSEVTDRLSQVSPTNVMPSPGPPEARKSSAFDEPNIYSPTITNNKGSSRARASSSGSGFQISPGAGGDDDDSSYGNTDSHHHFALPDDDDEDNVEVLEALAPGEHSRSTTKFDLCGSMWKRRGGLGRNSKDNWVMRCFTLYGPILCYHEESKIESVADPSKPRARLNLSKVETIAEMHSKQKPGLPSQDLLTINIYDPIVHAKRKWEMCCTSKEQQLLWYRAINAYDGKRVDKNADSSERAGEPDPAGTSPVHRYSMPDLSAELALRPSSARAAVGQVLDEVELVAKAAARAAEILEEKKSGEKDFFSTYNVALMVVALNVAIYIVRNASDQTYKMTVFIMNAFVLHVAVQHMTKKNGSPKRGPKARAAAKSKKKKADAEVSFAASPTASKQKSFAKMLQSGKTIPRAAATNNSELESQLQSAEPNSAQAIRAYSAASTGDVEIQPHTYANTDASTFHLRIGPNYKKNKQKAPSGPALYDLVSMDFLYADTPLKNAADKFCIPKIPGITDVQTGHAHIPPMLIVNTWLPGEEPTMFGKNAEGETYSIPMVFVLSKDTLEQLKDLDTASPGVKLLSEWCRRAEKEPDFRGRFKCMGMIENIESTGVPKFIQGYNGKPALVTKSGTFKRHDNYIEFTINVNMWAFLARKGLHTLTPTFPDFIFNIGFTIEARKDEEMPEVLLGGCRLMNLDPEKAVVDGVDDADI